MLGLIPGLGDSQFNEPNYDTYRMVFNDVLFSFVDPWAPRLYKMVEYRPTCPMLLITGSMEMLGGVQVGYSNCDAVMMRGY